MGERSKGERTEEDGREWGYRVVYKGGVGELTEKKSRFIATVFPVGTEEEAQEEIERTRKKYWDARHNCYAYVIGETSPIERCSDDGEPSQTAGRPMLDVLRNEGIHDVLVVVTRYFGGTLLGTGGLVRAYSDAVREGLSHSVILTRRPAGRYLVEVGYGDAGRLSSLAGQLGLSVLSSDYGEAVRMELLVPDKARGAFEKGVRDATSGRAAVSLAERLSYGEADGEVVLFRKTGEPPA